MTGLTTMTRVIRIKKTKSMRDQRSLTLYRHLKSLGDVSNETKVGRPPLTVQKGQRVMLLHTPKGKKKEKIRERNMETTRHDCIGHLSP